MGAGRRGDGGVGRGGEADGDESAGGGLGGFDERGEAVVTEVGVLGVVGSEDGQFAAVEGAGLELDEPATGEDGVVEADVGEDVGPDGVGDTGSGGGHSGVFWVAAVISQVYVGQRIEFDIAAAWGAW